MAQQGAFGGFQLGHSCGRVPRNGRAGGASFAPRPFTDRCQSTHKAQAARTRARGSLHVVPLALRSQVPRGCALRRRAPSSVPHHATTCRAVAVPLPMRLPMPSPCHAVPLPCRAVLQKGTSPTSWRSICRTTNWRGAFTASFSNPVYGGCTSGSTDSTAPSGPVSNVLLSGLIIGSGPGSAAWLLGGVCAPRRPDNHARGATSHLSHPITPPLPFHAQHDHPPPCLSGTPLHGSTPQQTTSALDEPLISTLPFPAYFCAA